jgi:hypothetical protein
MVVGPKVFKWTYLLTTVSVTGTVYSWSGEDVNGDSIELLLDDPFTHLTGNTSRGLTIHCETYPEKITFPTDGATLINRMVSWPLPRKPIEPFRLKTASGAGDRDLQLGDHVRLRGRLLIENGHPRDTSSRGWLQVGFVFPELHPFDWTDIRLVEQPTSGIATGQLIMAAPLYEMIYTGQHSANRTAGVSDHLFLGDAGAPFHSGIAATVKFMAPPPPPGVDPQVVAVEYTELVRRNGTGTTLNTLRSIQRFVGGLQVSASVAAPIVQHFDGVGIADVNDPGSDRSVLLVDYEVRWPSVNFGHLWHTIRQPGSWSGLGDVDAQFPIFPGQVRAVAATSSAPGEAQFLFATESGQLWHTIRKPGSWVPLGEVNSQFAIPGPVRAVAATSSAPGEAQFLFATEDGHLWHTIRQPGSWTGLGDVNAQFPIFPGPVLAVAATCSAPGEAQFLFATEDGLLWHTIRHPDMTWASLSEVNAKFAITGLVATVAATSSAPGEAQFMFATGDGQLWHAIRHPDGTWTGPDAMNEQFMVPGRVTAVAATSGAPDEAQFLFATEDGHLWHTIRHAGSWTGLGDVNGQFPIPGKVRAAAATSSAAGEAQFLFAT